MGAGQSVETRYVRIWNNLSSIAHTENRVQMLRTLLAGSEYVAVAKRAGVYAALLGWLAAQERGDFYPWPSPMEGAHPVPPRSAPIHGGGPGGPTLRIMDTPTSARPVAASHTALATIPPPKRAMDVLHESYRILGLDDTKPLTHEALKFAYKRAAIRAHPDKGGSAEQFDALTRAYTYIEEVLSKLLPRSGHDGTDVRFTTPVTPESALAARGIRPTAAAPTGTPQLADAPPVALNPKKLDMNLFNKLFEENRLPDPDHDDGYGDWLKSQEVRAGAGASTQSLRGKYNKDVFNRLFEDEARRSAADGTGPQNALAKYAPPQELVSAPSFGTEIGAAREMFTKAPMAAGRAIAYTDLKHAYSEGSTFSQEVTDVSLDGRPKTLEEAKRAYGSAPTALSAQEQAALRSFEAAKEQAERMRQQRAAARDVDAETAHVRMQQRLMIRN